MRWSMRGIPCVFLGGMGMRAALTAESERAVHPRGSLPGAPDEEAEAAAVEAEAVAKEAW